MKYDMIKRKGEEEEGGGGEKKQRFHIPTRVSEEAHFFRFRKKKITL
jgi:hypothetical protein